MPFPKKTCWVVVTDGAGYRIFACARPGGSMTLIEQRAFPEAKKPTKDLGSDRPGRNQMGRFGARHALDNRIDWHVQAEREVARDLARLLNQRRRDKRFDTLVLVAPPRALGDLRGFLDQKLFGKNIAEVAKDLTHLTKLEVEEYLETRA
ncbi:MAG TPA: host attachment protein [Sphingomonadales bacterium]|nr:host attachment protein [Sphingomonadales bacterium]